MLRIAIPFGTLSGDQLRKLALHRAPTTTSGYGHFTTRTANIQLHWIKFQ